MSKFKSICMFSLLAATVSLTSSSWFNKGDTEAFAKRI